MAAGRRESKERASCLCWMHFSSGLDKDSRTITEAREGPACLQTAAAAARNEQKRPRCNSPAEPYCLSEEKEVCEEEKAGFLLEEWESSRPPRRLLKALKRWTFCCFSGKRQNLFMLLCCSNLHPGDLLLKVSHPPGAFEDHPGAPGGPWGPPAFCLFFPPSFIQNFPTVCEMTTRFHHGSWVVQPASSGLPVRDLAALPGRWGLQTSSGTFQMTGFCHLISSECERTNCPDALTVKLTV